MRKGPGEGVPGVVDAGGEGVFGGEPGDVRGGGLDGVLRL